MNDTKVLDALYDWAAGYAERLDPCVPDRRLYADAVDDVLAILDSIPDAEPDEDA